MEQSDLDLLQTVPSYHLQTLIKTRRLPVAAREQEQATAPTDASTAIGEHLFAPEAVADVLNDLSDLERRILRELVACGGRANSRDLALYLSKARLLESGKAVDGQRQAGRDESTAELAGGKPAIYLHEQDSAFYPTPHPHGPYEQALHHLLVKGLLFWGKQTNFAGRDYTNGVYDGVLIVPHSVRQVVRETDVINRPLRETREEPVAILFDEDAEGIRAFQRTLYLYWSIVVAAREGLPLVNSGMLARSALRQITDALYADISPDQVHSEMDVPRLLFIRLLLLRLGLLRVRNSTLQGAPAGDFFALPLAERLRRCARAWLDTPFWDELAFLPNVAARPGPQPLDPAHEEVVRSRQMVVELLLQEPVGVWQDIFAFIARAKLYTPYLLFPRQYGARGDRYSTGSNPYGWDFRLRQGWLTPREGWYMVEGGFIRAILLGPLHWLGLVETKQEGHINQFRASPHLSLVKVDEAMSGENETPSLSGKVIVQPNFDLIVLAPVSEGLLVKLDRFAERVKLEHIAQYRLTKASVTRAIQLGLHVEDMLSVLQGEDASIDIPQNVRYSLAEWERQARRVELWQHAALIEVDDPALLDGLLADEATRGLIRRRLSPTLAEAVAARLPALQAALWQRHCLPAITPAPEQDALGEGERRGARGPQWQLCDDGLLRPLYAVVDLFLAAEAAQFTTRDEQMSWLRITPATIQHAVEAGIALSAIIRFLQAYCDGGIPASFLIRLKLWGGGYGEHSSVRVEQMPMLYLSEQALQDVRADDALRVLLDAVVPAEGRLVRVPNAHLEQVIALLKERGFTVDS